MRQCAVCCLHQACIRLCQHGVKLLRVPCLQRSPVTGSNVHVHVHAHAYSGQPTRLRFRTAHPVDPGQTTCLFSRLRVHALAVQYIIVSCPLIVYFACPSPPRPCPCSCRDRRPCHALVHRRCRYVHRRLLLGPLAPSPSSLLSEHLCRCHATHATPLQDIMISAPAAHAPFCFPYVTDQYLMLAAYYCLKQERHACAGMPHKT